jgi:membrane protease YdiL (CAAX protease family)
VTPLLGFFALTYLVAWTLWIAAAWVSGGPDSGTPSLGGLRMPLFTLGAFAPGVVALWLTARKEGRAGVMALLTRLLEWRVAIRWYAFAVGYVIAIKLAVALVHRVATGAWPRFNDNPWYIVLGLVVTVTMFWGQAGEEIGWRGYALPRLAVRLGFARASILLGVIWAAWHLPLFFIAATTTTGQSFPVYLLQVTALSVAISWLYAHTNGSLLLTMLLHSAINNTKDIVPSAVPTATNPFAMSTSLVAWLSLGLLWISAGYFLTRMPNVESPYLGTSPH